LVQTELERPELDMTLQECVDRFLADMNRANHSPHTQRAYRTDLAQFAAFAPVCLPEVSTDALRAFGQSIESLAPATRARKQASVASFLSWACRQDLLPANPMDRIERVRREPPLPRGVGRQSVERILGVIDSSELRDRLLFRLIFETGLRISEALGVHIEDLDLATDNERLTLTGKGGKQRTILLDDPRLLRQLRSYLMKMGYRHGPLFRAQKNGRGGPLRYQSVQERWAGYCERVGVECTLHQLRHTHATELVNGGVSLATIRKRLGHRNLQTTLRYAEQSDAAADAEVRAWRRRRLER
jgi:site-specific recombinase XerD